MVATNRAIPEILCRINRSCALKDENRATDIATLAAKIAELATGLDEALKVFNTEPDQKGEEQVVDPAMAEMKAKLEAAAAEMATMKAELEALKTPPEQQVSNDQAVADPAPEVNPEIEALKAQIAALEGDNKALKESIEKVRSARPAPQAGGDEATRGGVATPAEPAKKVHPLAKHLHVVIDDGSSGE
jgi:chromosome segregation ATPase